MAVRGQATTEAALGMLAIVTVIVFGIHFSEVSMLSLKVQEASASAIWDATARKMHTLVTDTPDFTPRANAIGAAGPAASARYRDFDGRASKDVAASPALVFTRATAIAVTCGADNSLPPMNLGPLNRMFGGGQGGMSCYAESDFTLVPGFAQTIVQINRYHICSAARANGNRCGARTVVALGDWGLAENVESNNCPPVAPGPGSRCQNPGYYEMTKSLYEASMGTAYEEGGRLSQWLFGDPFGGPTLNVNEAAFFMAAVGEDWTPDPYQTSELSADHPGLTTYTVTPGGPYQSVPQYRAAAGRRSICAFGLPCDPRSWPAYQ